MDVDPRADRAAPWVVAFVLALPILFFRYPPMNDLAHHEGLIGLLRHFGDPAFAPPGLYQLNVGHGNQLFHVAALALSYVFPLDLACKIVVAVAVGANLVAASRLAAYLGASRWTALLVAPVAIGWLFLWGYAHDLIGLALLQAALPSLDRYCERPTLRGGLAVAGLTLALHFAHESGMVVFSGAALVFAAGYPLELRGTALRIAPFLFALLIAVGDVLLMKPLMNVSVNIVPRVYIPLWRKLQTIPIILFGRYERWLVYPMFVLALVAIVWLAVERARAEERFIPRTPRAFIHRHRFELFAAAAFAGYLVFPATLNGAVLVYQRFLAPAYVVAVLAAAPRKGAMGAVPRALATLIPILALAALWPAIEDSSQVHRDLDRLFPLVHTGSAVTMVDLDPVDPARAYVVAGASARVLAERGGRLLVTFTESPNAIVVTRPAVRWDEPVVRLLRGPLGFMPAHDMRRFRYVIVHTTVEANAALAIAAMSPEARLVAVEGEWLLFESTLDVAPVVSPDVPLETPPPSTLEQRMVRVAAAWNAQRARQP